jgi:alkanesulfonate monooxygenase SsuD/methylene tetrahydromethanopterin reductase-like flavin-dependent oxidoreductase (luciferase family)
VPTAEEARAYRYSLQERVYVEQQRARLVHGDPAEVREKLLALKAAFQADEIMIITITGDYESRRTSYRLVAEAFSDHRETAEERP